MRTLSPFMWVLTAWPAMLWLAHLSTDLREAEFSPFLIWVLAIMAGVASIGASTGWSKNRDDGERPVSFLRGIMQSWFNPASAVLLWYAVGTISAHNAIANYYEAPIFGVLSNIVSVCVVGVILADMLEVRKDLEHKYAAILMRDLDA